MPSNKKISELTEFTAAQLADDDLIVMVDVSDSTTKKVSASTFRATVAGVESLTAVAPLSVDAPDGDVTIQITNPLPIANGGTAATTASVARTNLGLGTIATQNSNSVSITGGAISGITDLAIADGGTGASTAADARTNLGVTASGSDTTYAYRANNLSDLANAATARTNLGAAASGANSDITSLTGLTTALSVPQGGTGATTLTSNNVILGSGSSAVQFVAPGTIGNVLTSNGTTWSSSAPAAAGVTSFSAGTTGFTPSTATTGAVTLSGTLAVANGGTGGTTSTGTGAVVLATNPALVGYTVNTASGVDGEWTTAGLTVYKDGVTPQHDGPLHVMSGSAGTVTAFTDSPLVVEGAGGTAISILHPDANYGQISFNSPSATGSSYYGYFGGSYNAGAPIIRMVSNKAGGTLQFSTGNSQASGEWSTTGLTCFASGVTAQHDGVLHVMSGSAGTVTAPSDADELVIEGSGGSGLTVLGSDAGGQKITLGSATLNEGGGLAWNYASNVLYVQTNRAGAAITFRPDAGSARGEWNTTGLTCYASGVTPQHDSVLHVMKASAGAVTAGSQHPLVVEMASGGTGAGINLLNADTGYSQIAMGSPTNSEGFEILYRYTDSAAYIRTKFAGASLVFASGNTTTAMTIDSAGQITKPLQPAFLAFVSSALANVTGDSTVYQVPFGTEIYDQNGDFASPTFTAPVTGRYHFEVSIFSDGSAGTSTSFRVNLVTSNRTIRLDHKGAGAWAGNDAQFGGGAYVDMDVGDTASVNFIAAGGGLTIDIGTMSYFSGCLVA